MCSQFKNNVFEYFSLCVWVFLWQCRVMIRRWPVAITAEIVNVWLLTAVKRPWMTGHAPFWWVFVINQWVRTRFTRGLGVLCSQSTYGHLFPLSRPISCTIFDVLARAFAASILFHFTVVSQTLCQAGEHINKRQKNTIQLNFYFSLFFASDVRVRTSKIFACKRIFRQPSTEIPKRVPR